MQKLTTPLIKRTNYSLHSTLAVTGSLLKTRLKTETEEICFSAFGGEILWQDLRGSNRSIKDSGMKPVFISTYLILIVISTIVPAAFYLLQACRTCRGKLIGITMLIIGFSSNGDCNTLFTALHRVQEV